jgi:hypothetical protein
MASMRGSHRGSSASPRARSSRSPAAGNPGFTEITTLAPAVGLSQERRELLCSVIGLTVKCSLALVAGVSLVRLAGAYQERMERQGELAAVLDLEQAKLARARERFDRLFGTDGEQRLIREQNQWIAPNRLRVVWQDADTPAASATARPSQPVPTVESVR